MMNGKSVTKRTDCIVDLLDHFLILAVFLHILIRATLLIISLVFCCGESVFKELQVA